MIALRVWATLADGTRLHAGDLAFSDPDAHGRYESEFEYTENWLAHPDACDLDPESLRIRQGDLLFSRANTEELVGATAYVHETPGNLALPDKLWRFVFSPDSKVEPLFVLALFQHPSTRRQLSRLATGTSGSMKNISQAKLHDMAIMFPLVELQRQFAQKFQSIQSIVRQAHSALAKSTELFESLVHHAFRMEL